MDKEGAKVEERLKSLIMQLQMESAILDKIVYKNKNQHRRCSYFQYLLKVRRDVRLLLSARLEEILSFLFQVINGKKTVQTVLRLESMKKRKSVSGRHNYLEQLLGVARLLSQMVEPMVKAAIDISSLLGRSFFMGFSLIVMSLLARLRVLVQQILLDVVSVYNMVSSVSQKKQSIQLNAEGIQAFREYYPSNEDIVTLECVWETYTFVLLEKAKRNKSEDPDEDIGLGKDIPPQLSNINYQTIEGLLGEDTLGCQEMVAHCPLNDLPALLGTKRRRIDLSDYDVIATDDRKVDCCGEDDNTQEILPDKNVAEEGAFTLSASALPSPKPQNLETELRSKVAFVSVGKFTPSKVNKTLPEKPSAADWMARTTKNKENPFFSLLTGGGAKDGSLF